VPHRRPTGWTLSGSNDGTTWTGSTSATADLSLAQQTRAFQVAQPGDYAFYRLELTGGSGISLAEIELLARP